MESNWDRDEGESMVSLNIMTLKWHLYACMYFVWLIPVPEIVLAMLSCLRLGSVFTVPWWPMWGSHWDEMRSVTRGESGGSRSDGATVGSRPPPKQHYQWSVRADQGHVATPEVLSNNNNERTGLWWREYGHYFMDYWYDSMTRTLCRKNIKSMFPTAQREVIKSD